MPAVIVAIFSLSLLFLAFKFYGGFLSKLYGVDINRPTPAQTQYDGRDFVPAKNWLVLFGHHFSSIAGAGPIVGPVLAVAYWGWLPSLLWLLFGVIFIGAVHDFGALMASIRHQGKSIAEVAQTVISARARWIFIIFVWLALILVIAVFVSLAARTLTAQPKIVLPSVGLIPVALFAGYLMYQLKWSNARVTFAGLSLFLFLIYFGGTMPVHFGENTFKIWLYLLLAYCFIASITPVQILLQPRDYLSAYLLFFGLGLGYLGIFWSRPEMNVPAFTSLKPENIQFASIWPMVFVTIACGAASGFHSLVSSGTTSKQLASEKDAQKIGYGGMLGECSLGVLALMCVGAGLGGSAIVSELLLTPKPDAIGAFSRGYGGLTPFLGDYGPIFAAMVLNAFVFTTLDTATRISRYISQELFKISNPYFATAIPLFLALFLAVTGESGKIWPVFGASNQLIAAMSLLVISAWLLSCKKPLRYTLIPAFFMLATTIAALLYQGASFLENKNWTLSLVSLVLALLAFVLCFETFKLFRSTRTFSPHSPFVKGVDAKQTGYVKGEDAEGV